MPIVQIPTTRCRWRFRIGLPIPFLFGHTTIEMEYCESGRIFKESYGFVGWQNGVLPNIGLFWLIILGVSCKGQWHRNAPNPLSVAGRWHNVSVQTMNTIRKKMGLLVGLHGEYNLYTRNSWQVPRRIMRNIITNE